MAYKKETVCLAQMIRRSVSLVAAEGVRRYIDQCSQLSRRATTEDAKDFIHSYFAAAIERRTEADDYLTIYDHELFRRLEALDVDGDIIPDVESQCLRAFMFGYLAGAEDRDRLPAADPGARCYNGERIERKK